MKSLIQLLPKIPPGHGGVERVAHHISDRFRFTVYPYQLVNDFHNNSSRYFIEPLGSPSFDPRMSLLFALKISRLLKKDDVVLLHFPSVVSLLCAILFRLTSKERVLIFYWHAFVVVKSHSSILGKIYEYMALKCAKSSNLVITTSPALQKELSSLLPGIPVQVLPCCISEDSEVHLLNIPYRSDYSNDILKIVYIGRLATYKRVDWLIESLSSLSFPWELHVVGHGPDFQRLNLQSAGKPVIFHGQLNEIDKNQLLSEMHILCLVSDRPNEAFGIVQLEGMASGIPSIALQMAKSGSYWVSNTVSMQWSGRLSDLHDLMTRLYADYTLYLRISIESRERYMTVFRAKYWRQRADAIFSSYL